MPPHPLEDDSGTTPPFSSLVLPEMPPATQSDEGSVPGLPLRSLTKHSKVLESIDPSKLLHRMGTSQLLQVSTAGLESIVPSPIPLSRLIHATDSHSTTDLEAAQRSQASKSRDLLEDVAASLGINSDVMLKQVTKVQRAYRTSLFVYKRFGPALFIDSQGNASHGTIDFMDGSPKPTPWMRVAHTASAKRLLRHLDHYWGLPRPEVLITVTGGAQDFSLSAELQARRYM